MTNIILFDFESNEIRFVGTAEKPEWIADDVCKALDLENTSKALKGLDDDEKGTHTFNQFDLLAIAIQWAEDESKSSESIEKIYRFVRQHGSMSPTLERIYHACRIHQSWATQDHKVSKNTEMVYLIGNAENKTMKIGRSKTPEKRMQTLQISSAHKLTLLACVKGGNTLEKQLHKEFSSLKISGEWFCWDITIIKKFNYLGK